MNINRFTQKSMEVVNACERIAYDFLGHPIPLAAFLKDFLLHKKNSAYQFPFYQEVLKLNYLLLLIKKVYFCILICNIYTKK